MRLEVFCEDRAGSDPRITQSTGAWQGIDLRGIEI